MSKLFRYLLPAVLLAIMLVGALPALPTSADATLHESYSTGTSQKTFYSQFWAAQSFNGTAEYDISHVAIYIKEPSASPTSTLTVSIRAVDGDHKPTGEDLAVGTVSCSTLPSSYQWVSIWFTSTTPISTGVQYAIVARTDANADHSIWWQANSTGTYDEGTGINSSNSGSTWGDLQEDDRYFRTYEGYEGPAGSTSDPTTVEETTATFNGVLSDIDGAPSANVTFQYYESGGSWTDNETAVQVKTGASSITQAVTGLTKGTYYYYRIKMVSEGGIAYGESKTVRTADHSAGEVATHVNGEAINLNPERKIWYAQGLYWVTYSDSVNMVFRTSSDGTDWGPATAIGAAASGDKFSIYFDNQYVYYVRDGYFRRGLPNDNSTISWSTEEQYAFSPVYLHPTISVDTEGYPYIAYSAGLADYGYVTKSSVNTGDWSTASGYPVQVYDDEVDPKVTILALTSGKMYAIGTTAGGIAQGRYFDGESWGSIEDISVGTMTICWGHSAIARGDEVHIALTAFSGTYQLNQVYYWRDAEGVWSGESQLFNVENENEPCNLALDSVSNTIYGFISVWETYGEYSENHIYYKSKELGAWSSAVDWITDTEGLETNGISHLSATYRTTGGYLGVVYLAGTDPYILKYNQLTVGLSPEVSTNVATDVTQTTATLQGSLINDWGESCSVRFQWGLTTDYGENTTWQAGQEVGDFSQAITSLTANITYHYIAQAKWDTEVIGNGIDKTFLTGTYHAPVLDAIGNKSASEGELLSFDVDATDEDLDELVYSLSNNPSGSSINEDTGLFEWTPGYDQAGVFEDVEIIVSDGDLTDSENITLTIEDAAEPPPWSRIDIFIGLRVVLSTFPALIFLTGLIYFGGGAFRNTYRSRGRYLTTNDGLVDIAFAALCIIMFVYLMGTILDLTAALMV